MFLLCIGVLNTALIVSVWAMVVTLKNRFL